MWKIVQKLFRLKRLNASREIHRDILRSFRIIMAIIIL